MDHFTSKGIYRTVTILFLVLVLPLVVLAEDNGTVRGVVTDNAGEALVGANVYLQGTTLGSSTDEDGAYFILDVPAGTYTAVAAYLSYKTEMESIDVSAGETTTQNFSLSPDALLMDAVIVSGLSGETAG